MAIPAAPLMLRFWGSIVLSSVQLVVSQPYKFAPACQTCDASLNYPCGHAIAVDLVTDALTTITTNMSAEALSEAWDAITTDARFKVDDGFYLFAYAYAGDCVAHGARADFVGLNLPEIVALIENPSNGTAIDGALQYAAVSGGVNGGWASYDWTNTEGEDPILKLAYVKEVIVDGTNYYVGAGFNDVSGETVDACTADAATACAENNVLVIMGTLLSDLRAELAPDDIFADITGQTNPDYKTSDNEFSAYVVELGGTETCLAHGGESAAVGMTYPDILVALDNPSDGAAIYTALEAAANLGGGWVEFDWSESSNETYKKMAYVMPFGYPEDTYFAVVEYNNVCAENYTALASCDNSPSDPVTGPEGSGECVVVSSVVTPGATSTAHTTMLTPLVGFFMAVVTALRA